PYGDLPKFANGRCGYSDVWVSFDPHLTRQTTKGYVKRGYAFGLVLHRAPSLFVLTPCSAARRTLHCPALAFILGSPNDPKSSLTVQASRDVFTTRAPLINHTGRGGATV